MTTQTDVGWHHRKRHCASWHSTLTKLTRPPPPLSSSARVPARGLGGFFKFIFPSEDDLWRVATADWLLESESLTSALAGQGAGVHSYVRSLGVTLLLAEVADPRTSDLTAEAAWVLVRSRALAVAATATDAAIQDWALSFSEPAGSVRF